VDHEAQGKISIPGFGLQTFGVMLRVLNQGPFVFLMRAAFLFLSVPSAPGPLVVKGRLCADA
jgi:hypothetical protein